MIINANGTNWSCVFRSRCRVSSSDFIPGVRWPGWPHAAWNHGGSTGRPARSEHHVHHGPFHWRSTELYLPWLHWHHWRHFLTSCWGTCSRTTSHNVPAEVLLMGKQLFVGLYSLHDLKSVGDFTFPVFIQSSTLTSNNNNKKKGFSYLWVEMILRGFLPLSMPDSFIRLFFAVSSWSWYWPYQTLLIRINFNSWQDKI